MNPSWSHGLQTLACFTDAWITSGIIIIIIGGFELDNHFSFAVFSFHHTDKSLKVSLKTLSQNSTDSCVRQTVVSSFWTSRRCMFDTQRWMMKMFFSLYGSLFGRWSSRNTSADLFIVVSIYLSSISRSALPHTSQERRERWRLKCNSLIKGRECWREGISKTEISDRIFLYIYSRSSLPKSVSWNDGQKHLFPECKWGLRLMHLAKTCTKTY